MAKTGKVTKMYWDKLLCDDRILGKSFKSKDDPRSEFERDVDRIVFNYPFRRLQNKTQVVPVPDIDFIHTRLTHTIEVATVGSRLGHMVGKKLVDKYKALRKKERFTENIAAIIQASCLVHDIGNPPFGHSGEKSIRSFFLQPEIVDFYGEMFCGDLGSVRSPFHVARNPELNSKDWTDLSDFEGNAMSFRVVNHEHYGGFNLTYATLAAMSKYPRESLISENVDDKILQGKLVPLTKDKKARNAMRASQKKFGFFQSEKDFFLKMVDKVGLIPLGDRKNLSWCRHPLSFLMEASDDICNALIDWEDAFKLGVITFNNAVNYLIKISNVDVKTDTLYKKLADKNEKIGYLRRKAMDSLIEQAATSFMDKESLIMEGKFDTSLTAMVDSKKEVAKMLKILETKYFRCCAVRELEVVGSKVIGGLVQSFLDACIQIKISKRITVSLEIPKRYELKQLRGLIPDQFLLSKKELRHPRGSYRQIMKILDFVSGMTDSYALQLYRKLQGIDVPQISSVGV